MKLRLGGMVHVFSVEMLDMMLLFRETWNASNSQIFQANREEVIRFYLSAAGR
jgi:hypothetical protein